MSFVNITDRTTADLNAAADINTLMENIRQLSGNGTLAPLMSLTELLNAICVWQMVQNHVTGIYDYAYTATRTAAVEIACLTTTITTKRANSRIAFDALITGEAHHEGAFILERVVAGVVTEIGSPAAETTRAYGITPLLYDYDSASTPQHYKIQYIDSPNVAAGTVVTYRVKVYGNGNGGFNVNHTVTDMDNVSYERSTSNIRLTEVV